MDAARYDYWPSEGFSVPFSSADLASWVGVYECLFTSFHVFEQTRFVELRVEGGGGKTKKTRKKDFRVNVHQEEESIGEEDSDTQSDATEQGVASAARSVAAALIIGCLVV
jgi:hypothetical protein